jgi:Spherulation-specific family 4
MPKPAICSWLASPVGLALALALGACSDGAAQSPSGGDGGNTPGGAQTNLAGTAPGGSGANLGGSEGGLGGDAVGSDAVSGSTNGGSSAASGASGGGNGGATGGGGSAGGEMGGSAMGGAGGQTPAGNGCIVPLYSYPSAPAWSAIIQAKQAHAAVQVVAIVNPASGPGAKVDSAFTTGIAKLVAAGIVPIGYVSTSYTNRGQAAVKADADTWRTSYPAVQGIFFDEQSVTPGDEAFYSAVTTYAKTKGFTLTVGNPGTGVPDSFLGSVDIMLSYENAGTPKLTSLSRYTAHRDQFGIIPYAAAFDATFVQAAAKSVRYVYVTDDDLPNPWDTLPSYFDALLGALTD